MLEASNVLVKRSKDGDAGYDPIVKSDELEKILGCRIMATTVTAGYGRVVWGLVVTGMGEGATVPVDLWRTLRLLVVGISSSLVCFAKSVPNFFV